MVCGRRSVSMVTGDLFKEMKQEDRGRKSTRMLSRLYGNGCRYTVRSPRGLAGNDPDSYLDANTQPRFRRLARQHAGRSAAGLPTCGGVVTLEDAWANGGEADGLTVRSANLPNLPSAFLSPWGHTNGPQRDAAARIYSSCSITNAI